MKNKNSSIIYAILIGIIVLTLFFVPNIKQKITSFFAKTETTNSPVIITSCDGPLITTKDFQQIMKVLEKGDPNLQFINMLSTQEQKNIYLKILNDYIVANFLIKKYLEENRINKTEHFTNEYKQYMKVMENTFNSGFFQKTLLENILVSESEAKDFYITQQKSLPEFANEPFTIETPGIEARATRIEDNKNVSDYTKNLKDNKDVISLGRVNKNSRGVSPKVFEKLESMKNETVASVELENGVKFALYRVEAFPGKWAPFEDVNLQVKEVLKQKHLERKYLEIMNEMKSKCSILIDDTVLNKLVEEVNERKDKALEKALDTQKAL